MPFLHHLEISFVTIVLIWLLLHLTVHNSPVNLVVRKATDHQNEHRAINKLNCYRKPYKTYNLHQHNLQMDKLFGKTKNLTLKRSEERSTAVSMIGKLSV